MAELRGISITEELLRARVCVPVRLMFVPAVCVCAGPACHGEDHEGVLVHQRSSQADGAAHQKDAVSAQRGGGQQDLRNPPPPQQGKHTLKTDCGWEARQF